MDGDTRSRLRLLASLAASNIVTLADEDERAEARAFFRETLNAELAAAEKNLMTAPALILATVGMTSAQLTGQAMDERKLRLA